MIAAALYGAAAFAMWQRAAEAEARMTELESELQRLRAQSIVPGLPESPTEGAAEGEPSSEVTAAADEAEEE